VAVLEKAGNVRMLPIEYRWSDVGSWNALPELHSRDGDGNWPVLAGGARLVAEDARGCLAYAEGDEVIALVGVRDLVVVRAGNATLVCPLERAQDVKRVVERLAGEGERFL
jgi:mannose-1-phosphate guanylyltransferase